MFSRRSLIITVSLLLVVSLPYNLIACACCADGDEYLIWTGKPDSTNLDILGEMKFDQDTSLIMNDPDLEDLKGLGVLKKDWESERLGGTAGDFDLVTTFTAKKWNFSFKTKGSGRTGVLSLPLPAQMVKFVVDIHDGRMFGAGGPALYKELRYKGTVAGGTGFFSGGIAKPTTYFLVFQGRGNGCDAVSNFKYWRLEIEGPKASYKFAGILSSGEDFDQAPESTQN
jgi:hypothetical protein